MMRAQSAVIRTGKVGARALCIKRLVLAGCTHLLGSA